MELTGIHHVTALTADVKKNYYFYTEVLGMRLVKKTVNQDEPSAYHLFYADEIGRPGTDLTFFETSRARSTAPATGSISTISLRVPNDDALLYWQDRLNQYEVEQDPIKEEVNRQVIHFRDPEGQQLSFVSDETNTGVEGGQPWEHSPVPVAKGITGLGPVKITVANASPTITILTRLLTFEQVDSYPSPVKGQTDILVFSTGEGGTGAEIHLETRNDILQEEPGRGNVHHLALRVETDKKLRKWKDFLDKAQMPNSGLVDRYYFRSVYFRDPNGILFELATDEPGFTTDEDEQNLGESLALPPSLGRKREEIESELTPLRTTKPH